MLRLTCYLICRLVSRVCQLSRFYGNRFWTTVFSKFTVLVLHLILATLCQVSYGCLVILRLFHAKLRKIEKLKISKPKMTESIVDNVQAAIFVF